MKPFDYYTTGSTLEDSDDAGSLAKIPYFDHKQRKEYHNKLVEEINNKPMTAAARKEALDGVWKKVREHAAEQNKEYKERQRELTKEFWRDAREELGYERILKPDGVTILEGEAYDRGHSDGYSAIFGYLDELTEFAEKMIQYRK